MARRKVQPWWSDRPALLYPAAWRHDELADLALELDQRGTATELARRPSAHQHHDDPEWPVADDWPGSDALIDAVLGFTRERLMAPDYDPPLSHVKDATVRRRMRRRRALRDAVTDMRAALELGYLGPPERDDITALLDELEDCLVAVRMHTGVSTPVWPPAAIRWLRPLVLP